MPTESPSVSLLVKELSVYVAGRELLRDVSLTIPAARTTVIVGASGAGKSVLLRILAGLIDRDAGPVRWRGEVRLVDGDSADDPTPGGDECLGRVGVVFQNFALLDQWTPLDNVNFAIDHRADRHRVQGELGEVSDEHSADAWLEELRVPKRTAVAQLSGGQKQRLAIARTLAAAPGIVLYDEPTSGLDASAGRQVAELIRRVQRTHRRTAVVVTHDYAIVPAIADEVLIFDAEAGTLRSVPPEEWGSIADRIRPVAIEEPSEEDLRGTPWSRRVGKIAGRVAERAEATGAALRSVGRGIRRGPGRMRAKWLAKSLAHYFRLVGGPSAIAYLSVAGMIIGFTATYFTFEFLPYRVYTQPLLIEDLLAAVGFALYRILVPILATVLVAARCGAAVAADVGVKQYGSQIDALRTLGVRPACYLMLPIAIALIAATPLLNAVAFHVARLTSLLTFAVMLPDLGPYFWQRHFHHRLFDGPPPAQWFSGGWGDPGWWWVMLKTIVCGAGTALISYCCGSRPKDSAGAVSRGITVTVLWATLFVLVVHFVTALYEF